MNIRWEQKTSLPVRSFAATAMPSKQASLRSEGPLNWKKAINYEKIGCKSHFGTLSCANRMRPERAGAILLIANCKRRIHWPRITLSLTPSPKAHLKPFETRRCGVRAFYRRRDEINPLVPIRFEIIFSDWWFSSSFFRFFITFEIVIAFTVCTYMIVLRNCYCYIWE